MLYSRLSEDDFRGDADADTRRRDRHPVITRPSVRAPVASPLAAIGFGLFFVCASTTAHFARIVWHDWFSWPIDDWVAGVLLVYGGMRGARDRQHGRLYQVAGW